MIKILEDSIDFSRLGNYEKKDIEIDIRKAVISRESRTLTLELVLNFVLPYGAIDKFKRSLTGRLRDVHEVKLDISYEGLVQTKEEALAFYIEHMIALVNGRYAHVTRTIYTDNWELADGKLLIYALGELSVEILNKEVADRFRQFLKRDLDLDVEVVFRNNSDVYRNAGRMMEERERAVFDAHRERLRKHCIRIASGRHQGQRHQAATEHRAGCQVRQTAGPVRVVALIKGKRRDMYLSEEILSWVNR